MANELMEVSKEQTTQVMEKYLATGDLKAFTPPERLMYYNATCQSLGLNPLTRPFDYIQLNGKVTLYAKKDATDQLRKINAVSIDDVTFDDNGDCYTVMVKGHDKTGRSDVEIGVVPKKDMQGNSANARMKALTKAKRRLTLSLCGLGWLDETELETIPDLKIVNVNSSGQIEGEKKAPLPRPQQKAQMMPEPIEGELLPPEPEPEMNEIPPEPVKQKFNEEEFLRNFQPDEKLPMMSKAERMKVTNSNGERYVDLTTEKLFYMANRIRKSMSTETNHNKMDEYAYKLSAIQSIFVARKEIQEGFEE